VSVYTARQGLSLLTELELTEFIATSPEDYVARAARLARDPERLRVLRSELRTRMQQSALTDPRRLARGVEDAFEAMLRAIPGWANRPTSTVGTVDVSSTVADAIRRHQAGDT